MSLKYTYSPKDSHDKMRYNSTRRKRKVRPQLALDVYNSASPRISLNTELLIEMRRTTTGDVEKTAFIFSS